MVRTVKQGLFSKRSLGLSASLAVVLLALGAAPALAATPVDTSGCSAPPLSQPFTSANDFNWYAYAPGESAGSFAGTGWTLSGGAKIVSTGLADGTTGSVLDLPSGSKAVSPVMCVSSDYAQAKAMVHTVLGGGGVGLYVAYEGTSTWGNPQHTGDLNGPGSGWGLSGQVNLQPANQAGYQLVQITLQANGDNNEYQVYDLGAQADASAARAAVDTSTCRANQLSQPFSGQGDWNWYAYAPGQSADTFIGTGWTLTGGAKLISARLADGATGSVLDLPSGAKAVSPVMCVNHDYLQAKAIVHTVLGGGGVGLYVAYEGTTTWNNPQHVGDLGGPGNGWGTAQANLQTANQTDYQLVQFTLQANGNGNEYQLYDLAAEADSTLAANSVDTSACTPPTLSQPFQTAGDLNWYTPAPGESASSFDGAGWTLTAGAKVIQTQLADGTTSSVLDLPNGSRAVSPVMCVTSDYPEARALVHSLTGGGGVGLYVSYDGTTTWGNPQHTGDLNGPSNAWGLSGKTNIQPGNRTGWQLVQFTLLPNGDNNEYQISNFEVDPHMRS
jgi:hypothetical protein